MATKKSSSKKTPAKPAAKKRTSAKKAAPKKPVSKKAAPKKTTPTRTAAKKPTVKKSAAKRKAPVRKAPAVKKAAKPVEPQTAHDAIPFGAVVGWASDDLGNRIRLRIQSTTTTPKSPADIDEYHYYIDKDQAALLGNFLFRVSGHTAPEPQMPKWLAKILKPKSPLSD